MWGPRGSHADSATTSDKTGVKTTEGPKMNDFVTGGGSLTAGAVPTPASSCRHRSSTPPPIHDETQVYGAIPLHPSNHRLGADHTKELCERTGQICFFVRLESSEAGENTCIVSTTSSSSLPESSGIKDFVCITAVH
uniref:Uncharacterized protein n=1 Tax=Oryza rufipogon TaxID=4529 RepID=A0A0E0RDQ3_ORYRU